MVFGADKHSKRDLIEHYCNLGYKYATILSQLEQYHNIWMSMCTLKEGLTIMAIMD